MTLCRQWSMVGKGHATSTLDLRALQPPPDSPGTQLGTQTAPNNNAPRISQATVPFLVGPSNIA